VSVAALFVQSQSGVYAQLGCECFDLARDARSYAGPWPVVAHPPCRAWGRLAHMAKPRPDERDLAFFALTTVRAFGGVLEHPSASKLFDMLPTPGTRDACGGWVLPVLQSWWGHRAPKRSLLYVCGIEPRDIPAMPFELGEPAGRIERMCRQERERTPPAFAAWLVELARRCKP
jgi:hypothetical protein